MAKMRDDSFWQEQARERLAGCLGLLIGGFLLFCVVCTIVYYCNHPTPVVHESPWINNDSSRPVTDIKELDYNRRLIIYRDEEPLRQIQNMKWHQDSCMYCDPTTYYEDYYENIYEYFHD